MMTIIEHSQKFGARKTAIQLINQKISRLSGLSLADLPDTLESCLIVDTLEEIIKNRPEDKESIKEILSEIDMPLVMCLLFG
jgi:hypothetical protein